MMMLEILVTAIVLGLVAAIALWLAIGVVTGFLAALVGEHNDWFADHASGIFLFIWFVVTLVFGGRAAYVWQTRPAELEELVIRLPWTGGNSKENSASDSANGDVREAGASGRSAGTPLVPIDGAPYIPTAPTLDLRPSLQPVEFPTAESPKLTSPSPVRAAAPPPQVESR